MKTIGLLGGMSWESTLVYYRLLNELARKELGGLHSAKILLHSFDFSEIADCQQQGDWARAAQVLAEAAQNLERAGAELILICTNTMHVVADAVQKALRVPLVDIIDVTAEAIRARGLHTVGLLGTKYTMSMDFYQHRMQEFGIQIIVPNEEQKSVVNRIIYEELCKGLIRNDSRAQYETIMSDLQSLGAQGIILGCTEITLLVKQEAVNLPFFDSTDLHVRAGFKQSLSDSVVS